MSSAELTVLVRVDHLDPGTVPRALWEDRSLVKTWAMRGTLHLLRAEELAMWHAALTTYLEWYLRPDRLEFIGLDRGQIVVISEAIAEAVADGGVLTREELVHRVEETSGDRALAEHVGSGWGTVLKPPTFQGHICFGPNQGRNVRFTNPRRWIDSYREMAPADAIPEVVRRFYRTYGPAAGPDFVRWWAIPPPQARKLVATIEDELIEVDIEGRRMLLHADDLDAIKEAPRSKSVRLLPAFDQYVVTVTRNVDYILPSELKPRVYRKAAWVSQVLLVDGRMAGVWKHERKGKRFVARIEPFESLSARVKRAAEHEAERYAEYYGASLELEWIG
jgi:hypothetical protein